MENASKALIIAGEILIGIVILSLASYIFIQFGSFSSNLNTQISETSITQFNVNFTNFSEKANISAQDIVTVINFANKSNSNYEAKRGDSYFVDVCIDGTSILNSNVNEFLKNNNSTFYYCNLRGINNYNIKINEQDKNITIKAQVETSDIEYNEETRQVSRINFHAINNIEYSNAILSGFNVVII